MASLKLKVLLLKHQQIRKRTRRPTVKLQYQSGTSYELLAIVSCIEAFLPIYAEKGVPDFWLNAMKNNEVLAEEVVISLWWFIWCLGLYGPLPNHMFPLVFMQSDLRA